MKKINIHKITSFFMLAVFFMFAGCSANDAAPTDAADTKTEDMTANTQEMNLTIEELKQYNGQDGMPAYVAYDGVIYDVSDDPQWTTGTHGGNMAGTDITEKLNNAPHGTSKLNGLDEVGKLVD